MIEMKEWEELIKKWETVGPVYQIPRRSKDRLKHFCDTCLPLLKDRDVVEIGANAGLFGYCISDVAASYCAVEPANLVRDPSKKKPPKTDFYRQLELTVAEINKKHENAICRHQTITDFCKEFPMYINTFVACFALYHFMDHELKALNMTVFKQCDLVIIQNRKQDRPTPHNSYKFERDKNVVKYFEKQGFNDIKIVPSVSSDGRQKFSEIIMRRK